MSSSEAIQYEVLYYKRTNKVHKSKGVSKSDGILIIDSALQKVTLLQETDGSSNASGTMNIASSSNKDIVKRDLQEDDTIVLGAYEVQIVGRRNGASKSTMTHTSSHVLQTTMKRTAVPLQKKPSLLQSRPLAPRVAPRQPMPIQRAVLAPKQPQQPPFSKQSNADSPPAKEPRLSQSRPTSSVFTTRKFHPVASSVSRKRPISTVSTQQSTTLQQQSAILPHIPLPATLARTLRPHQVTGVDFLWTALHDKRGAILADEMGLGKTLLTIALISAMHKQERTKQFIVVCPSSLVNNWANEFDKWIGKAGSPKRVVVRKGGEDGLAQIKAYCSKMKQSNTLSSQNGQVLIISYDLLRLKAADEFQSSMAQSFKLLIVDEGHRLKNTAGSLTLTALESIQCDARLCITATPIQNNLSEFFKLANFCCPGCLGDLSSFRRNYERPIAASSGPSASRQQRNEGAVQSMELDRITKTFMLRRLHKNILKTMLPPRSEFLVFCRPSPQQEALYQSITQETRIDSANAEALTKLTALRKLCVHPGLCDGGANADSVGWSLAQSGKLVVVDALLNSIRTHAPNDKLILVSNYTSALSVVESLILQPREYSYARLDGSTNVQDRQSLVDSFNRATPDQQFCLLLSSKAGGVGLNLIGANRLIMLDADWNPALDIQACGRIYRQGQTKPTFIYRFFTSGTIEEVIYQRQSAKGNLANMAVDGKVSSLSKGGFTKEELADCFTLKQNCSCDTKRKLGNIWPEYTGPDSLETTDSVLLELAASDDMNQRLGHIHEVQENDLADRAIESDVLEPELVNNSDNEEEMEFD
ncbi:hypothetical protein MPSEU_000812000 [Mayamaea pseudoterrestris]|nr:hypothetical protein MPSEU_000812000 [Mayamaea pseudoterrestris]